MGPFLVACAVAIAALAWEAEAADGASASAASCMVGTVQTYEVQPGDFLELIAARFGVEARVITAGNALARGHPIAPGRILQIDNRHVVPCDHSDVPIVINIPQRMLFHFLPDGAVDAYPVAVGQRTWPTPLGDFRVATRERNPTWDVPPSIQEEMRRQGKPVVTTVPPGAANPLGKHWLGLTLHNVGIHGTSAPASIYRAVTHGCIRLHPSDIAELFERTAVGSQGRLIYRPVMLAWTTEGAFLEVHPDVYRRALLSPLDEVERQAAALGITNRLAWGKIRAVVTAREGAAVPVSH